MPDAVGIKILPNAVNHLTSGGHFTMVLSLILPESIGSTEFQRKTAYFLTWQCLAYVSLLSFAVDA